MAFSDSHVHLNSYPQDKLESIFNQMKLKQVELVLNVGVTLKSFDEMTKMAQDHDGVLLAVGIHPGRAGPEGISDLPEVPLELYDPSVGSA